MGTEIVVLSRDNWVPLAMILFIKTLGIYISFMHLSLEVG